MNDKVCKALSILFNLFPLKKQVLFWSCLNQYNDNPKAIAEKLHEMDSSVQMVWVTGSLDVGEAIPQYMKQVKYGSVSYLYERARSAVVVDNGVGIVSGYASGLKRKLNLLQKRKKQFNISTWHGFPIKYILADDKNLAQRFSHKDFYSLSDLLVLGSEFEAAIMKKVTNNQIPTVLYGNPRNDVLVNCANKNPAEIKNKLGFPSDKKVILFAPTYRDEINMAGLYQLETLDIPKLCRLLKDTLGGEWVFAARFHQIALQQLQNKGFEFDSLIYDGHKSADMSEYILACDAIISDYSGLLFDCLHSEKPCFLYTPDYEEYCGSRGLYFQPKDLPYPFAETAEELYANIRNYSQSDFEAAVNRFVESIGMCVAGSASERVVDDILNRLDIFGK